MFEVGKKYKHKHNAWTETYEVIFVGKERAFVTWGNNQESTILNYNFADYTEHKEPRKFVRYINVYDDNSVALYTNRNNANILGSVYRISCVRVELTEGQFDD